MTEIFILQVSPNAVSASSVTYSSDLSNSRASYAARPIPSSAEYQARQKTPGKPYWKSNPGYPYLNEYATPYQPGYAAGTSTKQPYTYGSEGSAPVYPGSGSRRPQSSEYHHHPTYQYGYNNYDPSAVYFEDGGSSVNQSTNVVNVVNVVNTVNVPPSSTAYNNQPGSTGTTSTLPNGYDYTTAYQQHNSFETNCGQTAAGEPYYGGQPYECDSNTEFNFYSSLVSDFHPEYYQIS